MINTKIEPVITNFKSLVTTNNFYPLTKTQLQFYIEKGYSAENISQISGTTIMYIRHLMNTYNLNSDEFVKLQKLKEQIIELKEQRATINEIIQKTGEKRNVIKNIIEILFPEGYTKAKQATRLNSHQNQSYLNSKRKTDTLENATPMSKRKLDIASRKLASQLKKSNEILDLKKQGLSTKEIAETLHKHESTIKRYLNFAQRKLP